MLRSGSTCGTNADCASGYACTDCACAPTAECFTDDDCPPGFTCRDGECIPPECMDDADCSSGFVCENYKCVREPEEEEEEPEEEEEELPEEEETLGEEEAEEEVPHPPIISAEVPLVEEPLQPVTEEEVGLQQYWPWLVLFLVLFALAWFLFGRKKKKKEE